MSLASRDWNDMSSSSSDSSDEDENPTKVKTQTEVPKKQNVEPFVAASAKVLQTVKQEKEEIHSTNKEKGQGGDKKIAHLTDDQLLAEYVNKKVDDPKVIRVTACHHQQYKNILNNLPNAKIREIKDGFYILYFQTEEGLIQFFKEKIQKRYKFYFLPYMKRKESGDYRTKDQGRYQNRDTNVKRQKKDYVQRGQKEQEIVTKEEEKIEEKEEEVDVSPEKKIEEEKSKKSTFLEREHFQVQKLMNILHIESSLFDIDRAIKELESRRVFKDFNKVVIKTPPGAISKVAKLCFQIGHKKKYYLDKQPLLEGAIIELILIENGKDNQTKQFYERHHSGESTDTNREKEVKEIIAKDTKKVHESKETELRKENKQSKTEKHQKEEKQVREQRHQKQQKEKKEEEVRPKKQKKTDNKQVMEQNSHISHGRRLGAKFNQYFQNVSVNNLSTIINGFDQNQYVKRLKDESANIEKNWVSWKVQAEQDHIQALLKLVHRLKKSTIYNVELLPSLRNEKALLTAELKPRPQKERRPKVDVSSVNGYLS